MSRVAAPMAPMAFRWKSTTHQLLAARRALAEGDSSAERRVSFWSHQLDKLTDEITGLPQAARIYRALMAGEQLAS